MQFSKATQKNDKLGLLEKNRYSLRTRKITPVLAGKHKVDYIIQ
jgi:hypothetical protein